MHIRILPLTHACGQSLFHFLGKMKKELLEIQSWEHLEGQWEKAL